MKPNPDQETHSCKHGVQDGDDNDGYAAVLWLPGRHPALRTARGEQLPHAHREKRGMTENKPRVGELLVNFIVSGR